MSAFEIGVHYLSHSLFDPDIPLNSFVYLIQGDLLTKLKSVNPDDMYNVYHSLLKLISNPINMSCVTKQVIQFLINQLKTNLDTLITCDIIEIICTTITKHIDPELLQDLLGLYSIISKEQATQLTNSISRFLLYKNSPRIYYSFTGFSTSMSIIISACQWPISSSSFHCCFRPLAMIKDSLPIIFSFSTNAFETMLYVDNNSNHLMIRIVSFMSTCIGLFYYNSYYKKNSIRLSNGNQPNRMMVSRDIDTLLNISIDKWHSIVIVHKEDNSLQVFCNGKRSQIFSVCYPTLEEPQPILLLLGGNPEIGSSCFIGDITGLEWYHNSQPQSIEYIPLTHPSSNETLQIPALQISPIKSIIIGERSFMREVHSVVNQMLFSFANNLFDPLTYDELNTHSLLQLLFQIIQHNENLCMQCEKMNYYSIILQYILSSKESNANERIVDYLTFCKLLITTENKPAIKKLICKYIFDIGKWIGDNSYIEYPQLLRNIISPTTLFHSSIFQYISFLQLIMLLIGDEEQMQTVQIETWFPVKALFIKYCVDVVLKVDITEFISNVLSVLLNSTCNSTKAILLYTIVYTLRCSSSPLTLLIPFSSYFQSILQTNHSYIFCFSLLILYKLIGETQDMLEIVENVFQRINLTTDLYDIVVECALGPFNEKKEHGYAIHSYEEISFPLIYYKFIISIFNQAIDSTSKETISLFLLEDISLCDIEHPIYEYISKQEDWEVLFFKFAMYLDNKNEHEELNVLLIVIIKTLLYSLQRQKESNLTSSIDKIYPLFHHWKNVYTILSQFFIVLFKFQPFHLHTFGNLIVECGKIISEITCGMFNYGRDRIGMYFDDQFELISNYFEQIHIDAFLNQLQSSLTYFNDNFELHYYSIMNLILAHIRALIFKQSTDISKYSLLFELLSTLFPFYPLKRNCQRPLPNESKPNIPNVLTNIKHYSNDMTVFREKELLYFKRFQRRSQKAQQSSQFKPQSKTFFTFQMSGFHNPIKPIFLLKQFHNHMGKSLQEKFVVLEETCDDIRIPNDVEMNMDCLLISVDCYELGKFFIQNNILNIKTKSHWYERPFSSVTTIIQRRFKESTNACEIFSRDKKPLFVVFIHETNCQDIFVKLSLLINSHHISIPIVQNTAKTSFSGSYTKDWVDGKQTTYDYLLLMNFHSGRSFTDISQYYIFPWVVNVYDKPLYQLYNNKTVLRDFSLHRSCQCTGYYDKNNCKFGILPAIAVPLYLSQLEPYHTLHLLFEDHLLSNKNMFTENLNHFDYSSMFFQKLLDINQSTPQNYPFECIPQLYSCPCLFTSNSTTNDQITFPIQFAQTPKQFVLFHRILLESPLVSKEIHKWKLTYDYSIIVNELYKKNCDAPIPNKKTNYSIIDGTITFLVLMNTYLLIKTEMFSLVQNDFMKKPKQIEGVGQPIDAIRSLSFFDGTDNIGTISYTLGYDYFNVYYCHVNTQIHISNGTICCIDIIDVRGNCVHEIAIGTFCGKVIRYKLTIDKMLHEINICELNSTQICQYPITKIVQVPNQNYIVAQAEYIHIVSTTTCKLISTLQYSHCELFNVSSNGNLYVVNSNNHCQFTDFNGDTYGNAIITEDIVSITTVSCTFIDFVIIASKLKIYIFMNVYHEPILMATIPFSKENNNCSIKKVHSFPSSTHNHNKNVWMFLVQYQSNDLKADSICSYQLEYVQVIPVSKK
ncbi:BEACH domain-containing protein [Entamoeba marina]